MASIFRLRAARKALVTSVPDPRPVRSMWVTYSRTGYIWQRAHWVEGDRSPDMRGRRGRGRPERQGRWRRTVF